MKLKATQALDILLKEHGQDSSVSSKREVWKLKGLDRRLGRYVGTPNQIRALENSLKNNPYTGPSIIDYLNSIGKPSSYSSRATLAQQQGITNYAGTATQNTQLLNQLRGAATQQPTQGYNVPYKAQPYTSYFQQLAQQQTTQPKRTTTPTTPQPSYPPLSSYIKPTQPAPYTPPTPTMQTTTPQTKPIQPAPQVQQPTYSPQPASATQAQQTLQVAQTSVQPTTRQTTVQTTADSKKAMYFNSGTKSYDIYVDGKLAEVVPYKPDWTADQSQYRHNLAFAKYDAEDLGHVGTVQEAVANTTIKTPPASQQPTPQSSATEYTVKSGDTLSQIATQLGVKVGDISGYRSGNPNLIYPGEQLTIGKPSATTSKTPAQDVISTGLEAAKQKALGITQGLADIRTEREKAETSAAEVMKTLGLPEMPSTQSVYEQVLESDEFKFVQEKLGLDVTTAEGEAEAAKQALELKYGADKTQLEQNLAARGLAFSGIRTEQVKSLIDALGASQLNIDRKLAGILLDANLDLKKQIMKSAEGVIKDAQAGRKEAIDQLNKAGMAVVGNQLVPTLAAQKETAISERQAVQDELAEARFELQQSQQAAQDALSFARGDTTEEVVTNPLKLTTTQLNKGMVAAGDTTHEDFLNRSVEEQQSFVFGQRKTQVGGRLASTDLTQMKISLRQLISNKTSREEIETMLTEANLPTADELELLLLLDALKPAETSLWEGFKNLF